MTFEDLTKEAKKRIKERNDNLENHFNEEEYGEMAAEFPDNTRIVTHDGEVIPGRDSENYWRKVGDELNGTNLKFKNKLFDAMELTLPPGHTDNPFDFVAIDITEFSFDASGNKYNGYVDPPYRHRVRCDWH